MSNKKLLEKADIAVQDLKDNGGYLNPEQANRFIRKLLIQPTILNQARSVVMNSPQRKINKIQFASRILRPAVSGQALSAGDRAKPTTEQIDLNTKEVIAEVRLPYDVIEDNIERGNIGLHQDAGGTAASGGIKDTIMTLIAERAALDLEELALLGDTGSVDDYRALLACYLALATENIMDAETTPVSRVLFKNGVKLMPDQYMRNRAAMRHFISFDNEIEYRHHVGNRETALGDAQMQGNIPVFGAGVQVEGAPTMPGESGILTNPLNLIFGIQRQIQIETDKDIRSREYIIVLTARVDFQIEETEAVGKYTNIAPDGEQIEPPPP
jgi:hypothetical protein